MTGQTVQQLTLNVHLRDDATLENYLPLAETQVLLRSLQEQLLPSGEPIIFVHGPLDSGRTHLLQAACHLAGGDAQYLPLAELRAYPPADVFQGIETLKLVCLDDLQTVLGQAEWEQEPSETGRFAKNCASHVVISKSQYRVIVDRGLRAR